MFLPPPHALLSVGLPDNLILLLQRLAYLSFIAQFVALHGIGTCRGLPESSVMFERLVLILHLI